jgi:poly(3-hydroxybutyrate) depolymerase
VPSKSTGVSGDSSKEWNVAGVADRSDDVALVQQAIDAAQATGCVDSLQTVLVGFGRGGHLAAVVACGDTSRIAGLVMIRGPYLPPGCAPTKTLPVLIEADTTDAVAPFDGGWGSSSPSDPTYTPTGLDATRDGWAELDQCDPSSVATTEPSGVVVTTRGTCATGSFVVSRVSTGFGHAWPTDITPALSELIENAT